MSIGGGSYKYVERWRMASPRFPTVSEKLLAPVTIRVSRLRNNEHGKESRNRCFFLFFFFYFFLALNVFRTPPTHPSIYILNVN